jgi:eukaryotic-like serine/threonine-protein kinase
VIGETIGSYRVSAQLGRGVTGEIFLGENATGGKAAIKLLLPELAGNADVVMRFFNEAKTTAKVRHPGVIEIYETGYYGQGQPYVAMEHLVGESLGARILASGRLSATQIAELSQQVAAVLAATHAVGIVHRNLSPENVYIVTRDGRETVKVLGFDLAKVPGDPLAAPIYGNPSYVAPEDLAGGVVDARADVYSLGCCAFAMACGKPPFSFATLDDARQYALAVAPRIRSFVPDVPVQLDHLLSRLLAKNPGERPQVMDEISRAFSVLNHGALSSTPVGVTEAPASMRTQAPTPPPPLDPLGAVSGVLTARAVKPAPQGPISSAHIVVSPSLGAVEVIEPPARQSAPVMSGLRAPGEAPQATVHINSRGKGGSRLMIWFALLLGVGVITTVVVLILSR